MPLPLGTRLGSYEILAPLGAGGMGEVYKARDVRLGREAAIKVLPAEFVDDPERLRRFRQEADAVSALNHPNIVTLYEIGTCDHGPYLVLERIEGRSLRELIELESLTVKRLLALGAQIAEGLSKAHAAGIVHRDLKPDNVMVSDDGFAKILDFGLARPFAAGADGQHLDDLETFDGATAAGIIVGSLGYLSPEQAAERPADFRADQFSLGCMLYEMATGVSPFRRETFGETLAATMRDEPEPLRALRPELPPQLGWIVERCLAKDPTDRYGSTRDLARDLEELGERLSEIGRPPPWQPPSTTGSTRRRRLLLWTAAVLTVGSLATTATLLVREATRPAPPQRLELSILPPPGLELNLVNDFALSPDGSKLVFSAQDGSLWLRSLSDLLPRRLPGTDGALYPFWSPDSRSVGFFAHDRLFRIGLEDAAPSLVCEAPRGRGGSWSAEGTILFGSNDGPLRRVEASGGVSRDAMPFDATRERNHRWPAFLPDGRRFLYSVMLNEWDTAPLELRLGALDDDASTLLAETWSGADYATPGYVLYVAPPARTLFAWRLDADAGRLSTEALPVVTGVHLVSQRWKAAFSVSETGVLALGLGSSAVEQQLIWSDRAGRLLSEVGPVARSNEIAVSWDGRRAIAKIEDPDRGSYDLWEVDLDLGSRTRLTDTPNDERLPVWSRSGEEIFHALERGGTVDLVRRRMAGGAESVLVTVGVGFPCDTTPDGRWLLYVDGSDLWLLPLDGGEPRPWRVDRYYKGCGAISPDGTRIAYTSNEAGDNHLYLESFPEPGRRIQIGPVPAVPLTFDVRWHPRGDEIFFPDPELRMLSVRVGPESDPVIAPPRILFDGARDWALGISPDGERFLRLRPDEERSRRTISLITPWH